MHAAKQPKISSAFAMLALAAASAMLMHQSARQQTVAAMHTFAAGFVLKKTDSASTLMDGSSSLDACLKALVPSCLLDCITSSQNVPAMQALHYSTAGSLLVHMCPKAHGTCRSGLSRSSYPALCRQTQH